MKKSQVRRLWNNYPPRLLTAILILISFFANGQAVYNPAQQPGFTFVINKPLGQSGPFGLDARAKKADTVNGLYRAYNGTSEVLTYLNTPASRSGQFTIFVNVGGSLQSNGQFIGGQILPYWFLRGVADSQLVFMNTNGSSGGAFFAIANNLSEGTPSVMRTNLGLGTMATQSTTAGGTNLSGAWPDPLIVRFNGQLPSYYLNYLNLTNQPAIPAQINITDAGLFVHSGVYPNLTFTVNTPTFQQTLTAGNAISGSGSINTGGFDFRFAGTSGFGIPVGTTAQRSGSPATGDERYNTDSAGIEFYNGSVWRLLGTGSGGGGSGITALTDDGTASGTGSVPFTLATVNTNLFGSNTFLKFGVNGKGLVTSATAVLGSDITTALGFTPYNATNPAGYIPLTALSGTGYILYDNTTGVIKADTSAGKLASQTYVNSRGFITLDSALINQYGLLQTLVGSGKYWRVDTATLFPQVRASIPSGLQTLTYTQNALNNTLSISSGNTQTFLIADHTHAGLLDSGRANSIDSLRLGLKTFTLYAVQGLQMVGATGDSIGLGGIFFQPDTINTAGQPFLITNLPNKTATGTDSMMLVASNGKLFKALIPSGGGGTPAGSNTQIQFNNSGSFGASANLTWSGTVLGTTGLTASGVVNLTGTTYSIGGPSFNVLVQDSLTGKVWRQPYFAFDTTGFSTGSKYTIFNGTKLVLGALSLTTTGTTGASTFNTSTGAFNIPQYQGALTLTTTGTSGASTLVGNTLNIPQYAGGGGSGLNVYNGDSTLAGNRTVTMNGKFIRLYKGQTKIDTLRTFPDSIIAAPSGNAYFVGTSITYGSVQSQPPNDTTRRWSYITAQSLGLTEKNMGVPGQNLSNVYSLRGTGVLPTKGGNGVLCTIELGINDLLFTTNGNYPLALFKRDMLGIITQLVGSNGWNYSDICILSIPYCSSFLTGVLRSDSVQTMYKFICDSLGMKYANVYAAVANNGGIFNTEWTSAAPTFIHPILFGGVMMANSVTDAIKHNVYNDPKDANILGGYTAMHKLRINPYTLNDINSKNSLLTVDSFGNVASSGNNLPKLTRSVGDFFVNGSLINQKAPIPQDTISGDYIMYKSNSFHQIADTANRFKMSFENATDWERFDHYSNGNGGFEFLTGPTSNHLVDFYISASDRSTNFNYNMNILNTGVLTYNAMSPASILFVNASKQVTGDNPYLTYSSALGQLQLGGKTSSPALLIVTTAGAGGIKLTGASPNGLVNVSSFNDLNHQGSTYMNGSTAGAAAYESDQMLMYTDGANGASIQAVSSTGHIRFVAGGTTTSFIRSTILADGHFLFNTLSEATKFTWMNINGGVSIPKDSLYNLSTNGGMLVGSDTANGGRLVKLFKAFYPVHPLLAGAGTIDSTAIPDLRWVDSLARKVAHDSVATGGTPTLQAVLTSGSALTTSTNSITGAVGTSSLSIGTNASQINTLSGYANNINFVTLNGGTITLNGPVSYPSIASASDANYTSTSDYAVILPVVTANRTLTIPTASSNTGRNVIIMDRNTSGTFTWSFVNTVKDGAGNTISTLVNGTVYNLISDGTNYIKIN